MVEVVERSRRLEEDLAASSQHHRLSHEQPEHACNELEHAYLSTLDRENEAANQIILQKSQYQARVSEMRLEEQRTHLEAILRDQATSSDGRIRALAESSHDRLVAAREWAEEQQSELRNALEVARAEGTELQQQMGRAKVEMTISGQSARNMPCELKMPAPLQTLRRI